MAKARAVIKRRRAVQNIRKITQTMQLIATARFQRCLQRAVAARPYTDRITELTRTLAGRPGLDHPLLRANPAAPRSLVLVITSNRGLCGAYNASVLRELLARRQELEAAGLRPAMEAVGRKGINYLRFLGVTPDEQITDVEDRIDYARVGAMAERYMRRYAAGELARVDVVHMQFHSVGLQRATTARLLPIEPAAADVAAGGRRPVPFEFTPPPADLLARLLPEAVRARLLQCFNDALVSEQVARMVAMKAATDAAGDMIRYLTRQYNRARQTQITAELADIVGGANAVQ